MPVDEDMRKLILRAEALMKTNWLHAAQLLMQAVEENPDHPHPLIALGDFYQKRQLYDKAVRCFQSALKLDPNDDQLKLVISNTFFAQGEYQLAIVYYDKIRDPNPDVRYNKALALAYLGKNLESIAIMRELMGVIDNNPFIYFLLIEQLFRVGDYEAAQRCIAKAEERIGAHQHLLLLKALSFAHFKNWLMALNAFMAYDRLGNRMQTEHRLVYSDCAVRSGMPALGISVLEKAVQENPYSIGLYEEVVRLLLREKEHDKERKYLNQAKRFYPLLSPMLQLLQGRLVRLEEE